MPVYMNGKKIKEIWYGGRKIKEAWYQGKKVYSSKRVVHVPSRGWSFYTGGITGDKTLIKSMGADELRFAVPVTCNYLTGSDAKKFRPGEVIPAGQWITYTGDVTGTFTFTEA